MKRIIAEFKEFMIRGNMVDLAIGIVIGVAFGSIITSLVTDVIMPPIGLLLGRSDFSNLFINLSGTPYSSLAAAKQAGAPVIAYGSFINTIVNFLIIILVLFLIIKVVNSMMRLSKPPASAFRDCPFCYSTISVKAVRCPKCTSFIEGHISIQST
jgi:large conductance mechanosensitive channel